MSPSAACSLPVAMHCAHSIALCRSMRSLYNRLRSQDSISREGMKAVMRLLASITSSLTTPLKAGATAGRPALLQPIDRSIHTLQGQQFADGARRCMRRPEWRRVQAEAHLLQDAGPVLLDFTLPADSGAPPGSCDKPSQQQPCCMHACMHDQAAPRATPCRVCPTRPPGLRALLQPGGSCRGARSRRAWRRGRLFCMARQTPTRCGVTRRQPRTCSPAPTLWC